MARTLPHAVTPFDTNPLDALLAGVGWISGLSLVLVASSFLGFAFWWAQAMDTFGLGKLLARVGIAWVGIALLVTGGMAMGFGLEATLGYPLGRSSGGTALVAHLAGLRVVTWELATSHGLLHRLATRTGSTLARGAAVATFGAGIVAWIAFATTGFICFVVGLNVAFGG